MWSSDKKPSNHDLVVGGSGMLAKCVLEMATSGRVVSVLCRNPRRLVPIQKLAPPDSIHPICVDYACSSELREELEKARGERGPFERIVCWTHTKVAPEAPIIIATFATVSFHHILGSAAGNPSTPEILENWQEMFCKSFPSLTYQSIILGFTEHGWLTNEEISTGVWAALTDPANKVIVGQVEPWELHPTLSGSPPSPAAK